MPEGNLGLLLARTGKCKSHSKKLVSFGLETGRFG